MSHTFTSLTTPGAKYKVTVRNADSKEEEGETAPVHLFGPELAQPTSVYTHPTNTGEFLVSWAPAKHMDHQREFYEVVLSPDSTFKNQTCQIVLDRITNTSTRISKDIFRDRCNDQEDYHIAVRTVFKSEKLLFKSPFSKSSE